MKIKRSDFDYFLDITEDVCPMTFVKVRLQIEKMSAKETLEVRLKGTEPLKNVPDSITELGHIVRLVEPENQAGPGDPSDGTYRVIVERR